MDILFVENATFDAEANDLRPPEPGFESRHISYLSLEEAKALISIDVHSLAVYRPLFSLAGTFKD